MHFNDKNIAWYNLKEKNVQITLWFFSIGRPGDQRNPRPCGDICWSPMRKTANLKKQKTKKQNKLELELELGLQKVFCDR